MSAITALTTNTLCSGKEKTHKHKQICGTVPGLAGCQTFVYVFFSGHSLWGRKKHINKIPPKIPGQSRENFVYVFCSLCVFFAPYMLVVPQSEVLAISFFCKRPAENAVNIWRFCVADQGPPNGGFQTGGFPDLDLSFLFCLFCPFWDFPDFSGIFPICSGMVRGFSRFVPFLFLVWSEKLQNESSPNFSNFRPEFCPEFCSEFSPNFSRSFRASFRGKRRPEKIHQKSPPFFNAKFPGKHEKNIRKMFSGEQAQ